MATVTLSDVQLLEHAHTVRGSVVLITGAASGIGKEIALLFAKNGAKIVIGDFNLSEAQKVAKTITDSGRDAVSCFCDVTKWEDQLSLFELAKTTFGSVDIVIPSAGVANIGRFTELETRDGKLLPPNLKTMEVNLTAVLYTTSLALHYMSDGNIERLRAIVLIGSIASWKEVGAGVLYDAAKHGILGLMRGLRPVCAVRGIRLGSVHPWFADTPLINEREDILQFISGWPLTPVHRIAATVLCVASHPDENSSGRPWILPDDGNVIRLDAADITEGVYKEMNERARLVVQTWDAKSGKHRNDTPV